MTEADEPDASPTRSGPGRPSLPQGRWAAAIARCLAILSGGMVGAARAATSARHEQPEHSSTSKVQSPVVWRDQSVQGDIERVLEQLLQREWGACGAERLEVVQCDELGGALGVAGVRAAISVGGTVGEGGRDTSAAVRPYGHRHGGHTVSEPLRFAGEQLGTLTATFGGAHSPAARQREAIAALAHQCTLVIANARYTRALAPQRGERTEQRRSRSTFLSNLSHEVRSPLGIALNATELLLEGVCGELNPEQLDTVGMIKLHAEHLMELITDVLEYARIEAGTLKPDPQPLELEPQLVDLCAMITAQAAKKGVQVRLRPASEQSAVLFDRRHFRQVLVNLLTNACKYTPAGGRIEVWSERGDGERVRVCVRDSGIGIAPADRERVFTPFERLDHPYARAQDGTGLGLSLVQQLVQLNAASVGFESELGVGSTFWIEVGLASAASVTSAATANMTSSQDRPQLRGERVLLVGAPDDAEEVLLARYLRSLGCEVVVVGNEHEARRAIRAHVPALVLITDAFRPSSGARLASFVRDEERAGHIPVLLLTRRAFLTDVEQFLRQDVDRCLAKPVRLAELARACQNALDLSRRLTSA